MALGSRWTRALVLCPVAVSGVASADSGLSEPHPRILELQGLFPGPPQPCWQCQLPVIQFLLGAR